MANTVNLLGTNLNILNHQELIEAINVAHAKKPIQIATLNPEFLLNANENQNFRNILENMLHCVDGYGLKLALKVFKKINIETVTGADLVEELFIRYSSGARKFYFFGGNEGEVEQLKFILEKRYINIQIVGIDQGGCINPEEHIKQESLDKIIQAQPDILLVGLGSPKQEIWMSKLAELISIPVMIGVGGTFGFYSSKARAPKIWRGLHLEWLWRGLTEKGHFRRVWRSVVVFPFKVLFSELFK